jgi:hypothetical protein
MKEDWLKSEIVYNRKIMSSLNIDHLYLYTYRSLSPLFDNPKLDKELKLMLRDLFAPFCSAEG